MTATSETASSANVRGGDESPFGWHLVLDLTGCSLEALTSRDVMREYVIELCDRVLGMKRYGPLLLEYFGHADPRLAGLTAVQLIETSNVVIHGAENDRRSLYVDVFSCCWYDPDAVIAFTVATFGGELLHQRFHSRG